MNDYYNLIKKVFKISPFIWMIFVIFGYIEAYFFFNSFDINIFSFLNTSEIATIFLPDIANLSFNFLIGFTIGILSTTKKEHEEIMSLQTNYQLHPELSQRIQFYWKRYWVLLILGLVSSGTWLIFELLHKEIHWVKFSQIIFWCPSILMILMNEINIKWKEQQGDILINEKIKNAVLSASILLLLIFNSANNAANLIKSGKSKTFSFQIYEQIKKSDSTTVFVRKTQNYLFTYNSLSKTTSVYPMRDIKWIKYKIK